MVQGLILRLGRSGASWRRRGGAVTPRPRSGGIGFAAQPGAGDLLVQFGDQLIQLGRVLPSLRGVVSHGLGLGAVFDPHRLRLIGRWRVGDGFGFQVPAFGALSGAEHLGPLGAGWAQRDQGGPAWDEHLIDLAGFGVDAAELDRVQAGAVGFGDRPYGVAGGGLGEPVGPGGAWRHWLPPSSRPAVCWRACS
jgi:hypothetical protein